MLVSIQASLLHCSTSGHASKTDTKLLVSKSPSCNGANFQVWRCLPNLFRFRPDEPLTFDPQLLKLQAETLSLSPQPLKALQERRKATATSSERLLDVTTRNHPETSGLHLYLVLAVSGLGFRCRRDPHDRYRVSCLGQWS